MKAVIQRSREASVSVAGETVAEISSGYVVLLGVETGDTETDVKYIADKIIRLRLFPGATGERGGNDFDIAIGAADGQVLLVSQFTLLGDCRKGRRPDWGRAAAAEIAEPLYRQVGEHLRRDGLAVEEGRFGAAMVVEIANDGPVTLVLDSRSAAAADG